MECPATHSSIAESYLVLFFHVHTPDVLGIGREQEFYARGLLAKTKIQSSLSTSDHDNTIISFILSNRQFSLFSLNGHTIVGLLEH